MKIIDRYLVTELIKPFLLGIAGFVLIMTTDLLFTFVDMIINKGIPAWAIIQLVFYKLPAIMVLTFPVSFLFAASIVLGRLTKDNELAAMRTSGLSFIRISAPILVAAVLVSILAFFNNEAIVPMANKVSDRIIRQIIYKQPTIEIKEQIFFKDNMNRFFYVQRVDPKKNTLGNIMIYDLNAAKFPRVITAISAKAVGSTWALENGTVHSYDESGKINYEAAFKTMNIAVQESISSFSDQKTTDEMNSAELKKLISSLNMGGVSTNSLKTDLYLKYSIPITTLVFALLAIPLSMPSKVAGKSWGFALSVIIMFSFYVFASVFRSMGRGGMVYPIVAAWFPALFVSLFGAALMFREGRR